MFCNSSPSVASRIGNGEKGATARHSITNRSSKPNDTSFKGGGRSPSLLADREPAGRTDRRPHSRNGHRQHGSSGARRRRARDEPQPAGRAIRRHGREGRVPLRVGASGNLRRQERAVGLQDVQPDRRRRRPRPHRHAHLQDGSRRGRRDGHRHGRVADHRHVEHHDRRERHRRALHPHPRAARHLLDLARRGGLAERRRRCRVLRLDGRREQLHHRRPQHDRHRGRRRGEAAQLRLRRGDRGQDRRASGRVRPHDRRHPERADQVGRQHLQGRPVRLLRGQRAAVRRQHRGRPSGRRPPRSRTSTTAGTSAATSAATCSRTSSGSSAPTTGRTAPTT